ncbi:COMM domain-containing protein 7-like isoform X2 [Homalodisca vitripennis]|uniref:COMM domain-containing protein 7-like isoform X2 n=1 Tax=Homalodisca vitripennis TaxID=197043 RepID=UPI001EEB275A|nr:COMM domain-containing protein 7-like isoform X2 [Homalodisca vitripennis]
MENQVVDIDWRFGVTGASSDKSQEGKIFFQLKITYNTGEGLKDLPVEMDLNQFYMFLHELEKVKNVLEYGN